MAEHRAQIEIARPAAEVFGFLANPTNLPRWLPMLREAFREGPERVRVIGGGIGAAGIAEHARFAVDQAGRCLSWAAATGIGCAGDLRVAEQADGASVELTLRLGGRAERPEALARWTGDPALDMEGALRATLVAVQRILEEPDQGVTLVSGGMQADPGRAPLRDSRAYGDSVPEDGTR